MKSVGIIGGIAPGSTIEYYRQILARCREWPGPPANPSIIINSIDLHRMLALAGANDRESLADYLSTEVGRLAAAEADFAVFASNTPHLVFDELARRSSIPLISIVECTVAEVLGRSVRRPALLGTRFTMQGGFYQKAFARRGIDVIVPQGDDQAYVHDKYMSELVNAVLQNETREGLLRVIDRLRDSHQIDSVILGGTELPLILSESEYRGLPFFDTTRIHVEAIVDRLMR